jgi:murein DD-endopeptidase MepM/ murein hydrolase activator NlpD
MTQSLLEWTAQRFPTFAPLATSAIATVMLGAITASAEAIEVRVSPTDPQLGDTLSVIVETTGTEMEPPVVQFQNQTYATFELRDNVYRALLPTSPLNAPGEYALTVTGEGDQRNLAVWLRNRQFPTQSIWLPPGQATEISDYEFDIVDAFKALVTPQKFWNGPFLRPTSGEVTTVYGVRRYYNGVFAEDYYHRGVDYAAPTGTAVVAPAAGRVSLVGYESQGFAIHGNVIGIDHGQGVSSILMHLNSISVQEGDMVTAGQTIGTVGSTGMSTGPHLHWGLYVHGVSVDPVPWRYDGFE